MLQLTLTKLWVSLCNILTIFFMRNMNFGCTCVAIMRFCRFFASLWPASSDMCYCTYTCTIYFCTLYYCYLCFKTRCNVLDFLNAPSLLFMCGQSTRINSEVIHHNAHHVSVYCCHGYRNIAWYCSCKCRMIWKACEALADNNSITHNLVKKNNTLVGFKNA